MVKNLSKKEYTSIHNYLYKKYPKPDSCEFCGTTKFIRLEWANITGIYTRDILHYKALCTSCHRKHDRPTHCKYGHEFTEANTQICNRPAGPYRRCTICHAKWLEDNKEDIAEKQRQKYQLKRRERLERMRVYYREHREERLAYARKRAFVKKYKTTIDTL